MLKMSIILGGSVHTLNIKTKAFVAGIEKTGLPVNAEEARRSVMSCGQHAL